MDEALLTVRHALGGEAVVSVPQDDGSVVPLSLRYSPEYIDTPDKVAQLAVMPAGGRAVALQEIADIAVRQRAEMVRNDNGERAGYLYIMYSLSFRVCF